MNYLVTNTTCHVLDLLSRHPRGTVHSVYRKTINLSFGGQLAALQAAGTPLTPLSLVLNLNQDQMALLPARPGAPVTVKPDLLEMGEGCLFQLAQASILDPKLTSALSPEQLILLEGQILPALSLRDAGSFELLFSCPERAESIPFLAVARKLLADTSQALCRSCWEEAAGTLRRLLGLGPGLTPGGDDFLCGVLAGLILGGLDGHPFTRALRQEILSHLADTNDISAAFLRCALDGQFSQAVLSLSRLPGTERIFSAFSAIGHSSGTDTLCGIAYSITTHVPPDHGHFRG